MAETKPVTSLAVFLTEHKKEVTALAPKYVNTARMMSLALEATMRNPKLATCTYESVLMFCKKCAEAGTDRIGAGGMWAVPFKDTSSGVTEMVAIPDWRLIVEKTKKAGAIKHATAVAVYEGDNFSYEYGLEPKMTHVPTLGKKGALTHVYCVYTLPDDTREFVVMSWEEVQEIRDRTNAWKSHLKYKTSNPWVTDPVEQAKKTVIKRALKIFEGASPELTMLIGADNRVMGFPELTMPEPISEPRALPGTVVDAEFDIGPGPDGTQAAKPEVKPELEKPKTQAAPELTEKEMKEQIIAWGQEMGGSGDEAVKWFVIWSAFIGKDKKEVKGLENPFDLKTSRLIPTHGRAKKTYDAWKTTQAKGDGK